MEDEIEHLDRQIAKHRLLRDHLRSSVVWYYGALASVFTMYYVKDMRWVRMMAFVGAILSVIRLANKQADILETIQDEEGLPRPDPLIRDEKLTRPWSVKIAPWLRPKARAWVLKEAEDIERECAQQSAVGKSTARVGFLKQYHATLSVLALGLSSFGRIGTIVAALAGVYALYRQFAGVGKV